jgi:acetyl-CoA carboxylase carboxyl transferase subunit beta
MAFFQRKKLSGAARRTKSIPDGLWMKCVGCQQTLYRSEVEEQLMVCPKCDHHYRLGARARIASLCDPDSFQETHTTLDSADPLDFTVGSETYRDRVVRAKEQSGLGEALVTGTAAISGSKAALGVMDAAFIMASMGSVVGEKFCRLADDAIAARLPVVMVCASGGARMQEGILALMQMAKTADAVRRLNEARLPYLTVLTDPTTGGVFASFASLGDVVLAEPKAYIGFAGARLIEGALNIKVPQGFQSAEYQLENGFIDQIVPRAELRDVLGRLLRYLAPPTPQPAT